MKTITPKRLAPTSLSLAMAMACASAHAQTPWQDESDLPVQSSPGAYIPPRGERLYPHTPHTIQIQSEPEPQPAYVAAPAAQPEDVAPPAPPPPVFVPEPAAPPPPAFVPAPAAAVAPTTVATAALPAPYWYDDERPNIVNQTSAPQFVVNRTNFSEHDPLNESVDGYVAPERTVRKNISRRDVNRIHCDGEVNDVFYSQEKPVSVSVSGSDVFVKSKVRVVNGMTEEYPTDPIDLMVVCGDAVYTMILQPIATDAVTLRLGRPIKEKLGPIVKEWGALPIEEKVQRLTMMVYRDELPPSFVKNRINIDSRAAKMFSNVSLEAVSRVSAPGLGLAAMEFEVIAHEPVQLKERDFLDVGLSANIAGITIDPLVLRNSGQTARLIIVERSVSDGQ